MENEGNEKINNKPNELTMSPISEKKFNYPNKNDLYLYLYYDNNHLLLDKELDNSNTSQNVFDGFSTNKNDSSLNNNENESDEENKVLYISNKTNYNTLPQKKTFFQTETSRKKEIKKGRKSSKDPVSNKIKHGKNTIDNIKGKIKRYFIKSSLNYINKKYKEYLTQKKLEPHDLLQKINPKISLPYNKKEAKPFLSMTLYEIFFRELSNKYTKYNKDYNRNQLTLLYKKNEAKEVIDIMNKTVKEMYEQYISNEIDDFNLKNDLIKIEKKDGVEYKNLFEAKAEKFIDIIKRNRKKRKKLHQ